MKRTFLQAELLCTSPICIGNGLREFTDNDILVDNDGVPFIPGTTLAGICRHYMNVMDERKTDLIFGSKNGDTSENYNESKIIFYDAFPIELSKIGFRDGVSIDPETSTAVDTAKFDYEILNSGAIFNFRIELDDADEDCLKKIAAGFNSGEIRIGSKATRGLGRVMLKDIHIKTITDIDELIDFSWDDMSKCPEYKPELSYCLYESREYSVELRSFLLIANRATTEVSGDSFINSEQLVNDKKKPVIPGTSWAGVFRHYFIHVLNECGYEPDAVDSMADKVFGFSKDSSAGHVSNIVFDESEITGSGSMLITRNAVDRFTGGACDKKLFTNRIAFGGTGKLTVLLRRDIGEDTKKLVYNIIDLFVEELNGGYLNIGAMGSVGGGILSVKGAEM